MNVNEFCSLIKSIREEKMSRKEFARRNDQWHENTLKSYEKDRDGLAVEGPASDPPEEIRLRTCCLRRACLLAL